MDWMDWYESFPVLVIDNELSADNPVGRALRAVIEELKKMHFSVREALTPGDGLLMFQSHANISCVLLDWDMSFETKNLSPKPSELVKIIRDRNEEIPVFLLTEKLSVEDIPLEVINKIDGYIWGTEDTPDFIAGRIEFAVRKYLQGILPPFFKELVEYVDEYKYTWHTPGHGGGVAFLKSPAGFVFSQFFGEKTLRADLSVSVPELGSLLEHTEVVGKAEKLAAKVFGADRTYFVTNGTSTANKIVFHGCVTPGDIVLVDRNCHKSILHAIIMTRAIPIYLLPTRNAYGIIGPIHMSEFESATINRKLEENKLIDTKTAQRGKLAVITNSTYDGLCYNVKSIQYKLSNFVENIHFDEAWYGYAKFHDIYNDRYAMSGGDDRNDSPTIFATQSTHKVLAALSQASMIHTRDGKKPIDHERFNEAFMMHTSTSPQYGIIASLDVAAKMMEGESGRVLVEESIEEAIVFRKKMIHVYKEIIKLKNDKQWWFRVWQPAKVMINGVEHDDIGKVNDNILKKVSECWTLKTGAEWHGFGDLEKDYVLLDPIKVTILTPGISLSGEIEESGIPAAIVSKFLRSRGVVVEKTGLYSFLVLFTIGITKGKSGTLLAELFEFKRLYDENVPVEEVFPDLVQQYPDKYEKMSLQALSQDMHIHLEKKNITELMGKMYDRIPEINIIPAEAYDCLVRGNTEPVSVRSLMGRVPSVMIVPYPPGIPVIMPGEKFTRETERIIDYLTLCEDFDNKYPGFENEMHGIAIQEDNKGRKIYYIDCVTGA